MTTVRKSLGFAFLERYLLIALQLLSFTLLARLLTPQQIGLYSVSMALISVAQVIRDFGLANYLIQRDSLDDDDIGTAFGMSLIFGAALFVAVNAAAPLVASFYKEASLTTIVRLISLNFLILPFNSIIVSLLRRDMLFSTLMRINVCAAVVATTTTLGLAFLGMGTWSLALGEIASNCTILLGVLLVGGSRHLRRPRLQKWQAVLGFGGPVTAANIVTSISMDISDLVVGKVLNFSQVAIASRAQGLMNLFNRDIMGTIRTVAYPAYSRTFREKNPLEAQFMASVTAVTAIAWPFYGFVALFPLEVLRLMFGPQWDLAAPLVPWFCLAGAFSALNNLIPTLMLAGGHARLVSMADLIIQPVKAAALSFVVFYYRDLMPFTIAFVIIAFLAVPYFYAFKQARLPTDFSMLWRLSTRNFLVTAGALVPAITIILHLRPAGAALPLPLFFVCVFATLASWLMLMGCSNHLLYREFMLILRSKFAPKPL